MELNLLEAEDGITRVALSGRLDTEGVDVVETRFSAATVADGRNAIVDLSGTSFIASMGIRMLVVAAKALAGKGSTMVLLSPQPLVEEYMTDANLGELIPIVHSEEEALDRFRE
jgi:anti-anti-sigma factor